MDPEVLHALLAVAALDSNQTCADCGEKEPAWASLGFGTFICLNCAGHHRSLGVHITKVRSVRLDAWTREQVRVMEEGGNVAFLDYLATLEDLSSSSAARRRYEHPQILHYT
ncbi:hypothetical protein EON63_10255 [archaeon]|nr:MAG: hypothetical protein EON63_10255 [archaeon]